MKTLAKYTGVLLTAVALVATLISLCIIQELLTIYFQ